MYKVKIYGNKLIEYFEFYDNTDVEDMLLLKSLNQEIDEYINNIINMYSYNESKIYFYYKSENSTINNNWFNCGIARDYHLVYEFDTEEEAFYFKLKFC